MSILKEMERLKQKFNRATAAADSDGINVCIVSAKNLLTKAVSERQRFNILYSIATGYSDIEEICKKKLNGQQLEELQENYIFYYRSALDMAEELDCFHDNRQQQLCTNAGFAYNKVGRIFEAQRLFEKASEESGFPVAWGHTGITAFKLAHIVYLPNHSDILSHFANFSLTNMFEHEEIVCREGIDITLFKNVQRMICEVYPSEFLDTQIDLGKYDWGKTKKEQEYRKWCTLYSLFLNELNDFTTDPIVATDYLHLPNMVYEVGSERWKFHYGMFNQIKQEYCSARYQFYEGIQQRRSAHLADREVLQIELGMNVHSYGDYSIKMAFRALYSLFDRIAFFINEYFEVGIPVRQVSFRGIWRKNLGTDEKPHVNKLHEIRKHNEMLNALYWLAKDIHEEHYTRSTKPTSKEFDFLRNRLEHRYAVSVLGDRIGSDKFTYQISTTDLYNKTMEIMKLAREAILYLSFALNLEERKKRENAIAQGKKIAKLDTWVIPDVAK